MAMEAERVCVTGAGGFLASWVVKLLLSKGRYVVHGTVRNPADEKNALLTRPEGATDNLKLFKADLLDYESLRSAIAGCTGVLHVACPVPTSAFSDPEVEMLEPAIKGTVNVLKACSEAKVKRVVCVSSIVAMALNPSWPRDQVMDEASWSDKERCRATENWYCLAKTEAESLAFEYGKREGFDVISVLPGAVFGPLLQPTLNSSTMMLMKFVKGGEDPVINIPLPTVDVRDVAEALVMTYEKPEAEGRYICTAYDTNIQVLEEKLCSLYPDFTHPTNYVKPPVEYTYKASSKKLQKLGWTYRPLEETLVDSIECLKAAGMI